MARFADAPIPYELLLRPSMMADSLLFTGQPARLPRSPRRAGRSHDLSEYDLDLAEFHAT